MEAPLSRPVGPALDGFVPPPAPGPERIDGRSVRLERLDPLRHARSLFDANCGADWVWDYLGYGPFAEFEDYRRWQEAAATSVDPFFYAFVEGQHGAALGLGSFLRIDRNHGVIEIGHIQISPPMQRSTAASEAIMLMVGWAFDAGYRRVEWKCDALNAASRAAAERFGFTFEGVFRQHMIVKGRNRDTAWFSITDADWPHIRQRWAAWLAPENFDAAGRQRRRLSEIAGG